MIGNTLSHYKIISKLGQGGMGEVYLAEDSRLDRKVALKILPQHLSDRAELRERFEREARAVSSLNHPHICTLYDIGEQDGIHYLVMEHLVGETLEARLAKGPLPLEQTLEYAIQIADALDKAHRQGVLHRDLKPGNIMLVKSGAKLLDFGLAKLQTAETPTNLSALPTEQANLTAEGTILGTLQYMAPEQLEGKDTDSRTDIFAFGAVVYEMATGKKAFEGSSQASLIGAIMQSDPRPMAELQPMTPSTLEHVVRRCLAKQPEKRWQAASDVMAELSWVTEIGTQASLSASVTSSPLWKRGVPLGVAALFGVLATSMVFWFSGPTPSSVPNTLPVSRTTIYLPDGQRQPRMMHAPLAISPDGALLAYVARDGTGSHLFLRPLDSFESRKIPGSENAASPFFSPDSQWVGFFAPGKLKKASVVRGSPVNIANTSVPLGASWGRDNTIVFTPALSAGLWRVSADGGTPEQLTQPDFGEDGYAHVWPQHLPDGRHVLFNRWGNNAVRILDLETGRMKVARQGHTGGAMHLSSGHLASADTVGSGSLLVAPFNLQDLSVGGSTIPVLDDVRFYDSMSHRPYMAVSHTGTAVYMTHKIGEATLMWVDREGNTDSIQSSERMFAGIRLSPNGNIAVFDDEQGNLWRLDVQRGSVDILLKSTEEFNYGSPTWHPDGRQMTFSSNEAGSWDLYQIDMAERGEPQALLVGEFDQFPGSWSDNGILAYLERHPQTGADIWVLSGDEEPVPVLQTTANESSPAFSPDGRLLAYVSDESGRLQIYLRIYPEGQVLGVSIDGGEEPVWSRNGREPFFRQGDRFLAVTVTTEPELEVSVPAVLFERPFDRPWAGSRPYYDVSSDGRFVVVSERPTTEFKVIQNWFEELERLVPTDN